MTCNLFHKFDAIMVATSLLQLFLFLSDLLFLSWCNLCQVPKGESLGIAAAGFYMPFN